MRTLVCAVLVVAFAFHSLCADERADALVIIDQAVKAVGGADKLKTLQAVTWKSKTKATVDGQEINFTASGAIQGNDRCRIELDVQINNNNAAIILVFTKDKGWIKGNDNDANEAPKNVVAMMMTDLLALRLAELLLPLKENNLTLSPLGETKINDRAVLGVKVTPKDRPEINMFFDKETGLPAKCEMQVKESEDAAELLHEFFFSDYKDFEGVKHFTKFKVKRDGKDFMETEVSELKSVEKHDEGMFGKP